MGRKKFYKTVNNGNVVNFDSLKKAAEWLQIDYRTTWEHFNPKPEKAKTVFTLERTGKGAVSCKSLRAACKIAGMNYDRVRVQMLAAPRKNGQVSNIFVGKKGTIERVVPNAVCEKKEAPTSFAFAGKEIEVVFVF